MKIPMLQRLNKIAIAICGLAFLTASLPAAGQAIDNDKFNHFIYSDLNKLLVHNAIDGYPPSVFKPCTSLRSSGGRTVPLSMITFGADGSPDSGKWALHMPVTGCGSDITLNFFFFVGREGKIETLVGIPGTTHADPNLQDAATKFARISAGLKDKTCRRFDITNSEFIGYGIPDQGLADPGPSAGSQRPWTETWTVSGCGHTYKMPVQFTPQGDHATTVIPVEKIVDVSTGH